MFLTGTVLVGKIDYGKGVMTRHPKVAFHFPCWSLTNQFAHGVLMMNPKACSERCKLPRNAAHGQLCRG